MEWISLIYLFNAASKSTLYVYMVQHHYTVKPQKRDHTGDQMFGPCREAGPISEVFLQIHCMSL